MNALKIILFFICYLLNGWIMAQTQRTYLFLQPFHIDIDPMERLLLINIEKDPDSVYIGFEPQVFNDPKNGKGHLVIGWRVDGRVDVYYQQSLHMDPTKYDIAGKGLAHMIPTTMDFAYYEVLDFGVDAHYEFKDLRGRSVKLLIQERHPRKRQPFGLLAPMGDAAESPSAMPLVLLHDFYFVRRNNTVIEVAIDGRKHKPDRLPILMDFTKMYFARYSPDPLIATFNPSQREAPCNVHEVDDQTKLIEADGHTIHFERSNGALRIDRIHYYSGTHPISLHFIKGFPDLLSLEMGAFYQDQFIIEGDPSTGKIAGHYHVKVEVDHITLQLIPSGGWKPKIDKFSLRFMYTVAKVFKKWPSTYQWEARISCTTQDGFIINSEWERIKP